MTDALEQWQKACEALQRHLEAGDLDGRAAYRRILDAFDDVTITAQRRRALIDPGEIDRMVDAYRDEITGHSSHHRDTPSDLSGPTKH